jgi:hypothetical protein
MEVPFPFTLKKLKVRRCHDRLLCTKKDCKICKREEKNYIANLDRRLNRLLRKHPEIS